MPRSTNLAQRKAPHLPRWPIRAAMWRWRWVILTGALVMCGQTVITVFAPEAEATRNVVVAAHDLTAGHVLTEEDVTLKRIPTSLSPPGTPSHVDRVTGKSIVAPVPAGAPILSSQILDEKFINAAPHGTKILPIAIADTGGTELLQVGSYVDLYAPPDEEAESSEAVLAASEALIVGKATTPGESSILHESEPKTVFYLAIPDKTVSIILGISSRTQFHAVLSG